jgi:hypothetical protein
MPYGIAADLLPDMLRAEVAALIQVHPITLGGRINDIDFDWLVGDDAAKGSVLVKDDTNAVHRFFPFDFSPSSMKCRMASARVAKPLRPAHLSIALIVSSVTRTPTSGLMPVAGRPGRLRFV